MLVTAWFFLSPIPTFQQAVLFFTIRREYKKGENGINNYFFNHRFICFQYASY